ncbi:hypothetical protein DIPPA_35571 [Diplonema papillatum]|nr:hypothetical protein DIPPA_35571 [Diplonema papillatum]
MLWIGSVAGLFADDVARVCGGRRAKRGAGRAGPKTRRGFCGVCRLSHRRCCCRCVDCRRLRAHCKCEPRRSAEDAGGAGCGAICTPKQATLGCRSLGGANPDATRSSNAPAANFSEDALKAPGLPEAVTARKTSKPKQPRVRSAPALVQAKPRLSKPPRPPPSSWGAPPTSPRGPLAFADTDMQARCESMRAEFKTTATVTFSSEWGFFREFCSSV